jgi:hypothetical protein
MMLKAGIFCLARVLKTYWLGMTRSVTVFSKRHTIVKVCSVGLDVTRT